MTKHKIVYTLRIHLALVEMGFKYKWQMQNPCNPNYYCWVYEETPEFLDAFIRISKEGRNGRK